MNMAIQKTKHFDFVQDLDFDQILTNPILDIAASVWEAERYNAFKICYKSMRIIDDLIDNRKAIGGNISETEKRQFEDVINELVRSLNNGQQYNQVQQQLVETIERFDIPLWPWQKLSKAMVYDLHHEGFSNFDVFLKYSEGAAVAPGSIFMHLCGVVRKDGCYLPPQFDIQNAARPLALFCYLVHIIRDFQKDQSNNLNCFADDLIAENGLNPSMLREVAAGGEIDSGFRNLMNEYYASAEHYRHLAREMIDNIGTYLEPRYRLSLEIIYNLYLQIFERIDIQNGNFTGAELNPSPEEVQDRINMTISSFESNNSREMNGRFRL